MKPRNRIFIIMGVLTVFALVWYLLSTNRSTDLQLVGTVDANEVIVSSRIQGRITSLNVTEGQHVTAGQLVATIESDDLAAARNAAEASVNGARYKLAGSRDTERQTVGQTTAQVTAAQAQLRVARPLSPRPRHNTNISKPTPAAPSPSPKPASPVSRPATKWSPA